MLWELYQQLSLNPQKLAGQCGKLKCCLNFELDTYLDALQDFPRTDVKLHTQRGMASCQKIDIFKRLMWFTYDENPITWHKLSVDSVKEIIEINKEGEPIEELEEYAIVTDLSSRKNTSAYEGIELAPVEEDSIIRFDTPKRKKTKRNNKKNTNANKPQRDNKPQQAQVQAQQNQPNQAQSGQPKQGQPNKKKQQFKPKNNSNNANNNGNNNPNAAKKKFNNKNNKPKAPNADKPKNENV